MARGFPPKSEGHNRKRLGISTLDLVVLLANVLMVDKAVGFEDAERTLEEYVKDAEFKVFIRKEMVESGLWACNTMDELNKFWHPRRLTFDQFVSKMLDRESYKFNKDYNWIEEKKR